MNTINHVNLDIKKNNIDNFDTNGNTQIMNCTNQRVRRRLRSL